MVLFKESSVQCGVQVRATLSDLKAAAVSHGMVMVPAEDLKNWAASFDGSIGLAADSYYVGDSIDPFRAHHKAMVKAAQTDT